MDNKEYPHEVYNYLDGPKTVKWLESMGYTAKMADKEGTYFHKWRKGRAISVYYLDKLLTRWGIGLWEVPVNCWLKGDPYNSGNPNSPDARKNRPKRQ